MALDRHGVPIPVFVPPRTTKPPSPAPPAPDPHQAELENDVAVLKAEFENLKARVAELEARE